MAARDSGVSYDQLHHFIGRGVWDATIAGTVLGAKTDMPTLFKPKPSVLIRLTPEKLLVSAAWTSRLHLSVHRHSGVSIPQVRLTQSD